MKKLMIVLFILIGVSFLYSEEVRYRPYVLAGIEKGEFNDVVAKSEKLLTDNGFEIVGKYSPLKDPNRVVICTTHKKLKESVEKFGGIIAFAAVLKFALYKENDNIEICYQYPLYWGNAFFRKKFPEVAQNYNVLNFNIENMFKELSVVKNQPYGSKKGLTDKKLRGFHFMIFMPYFDDVTILAKMTNYEDVIKRIEANLAKKVGSVEKVYSISFPEKKLTLYGAALFHPEEGENYYVPKLDKRGFAKQFGTLPYDFLVMEDKVVMMHGKYNVPLAVPDAGMGTFMKMMSGHSNTKKALSSVVNTK